MTLIRRSLGTFGISGVLITIFIGLFVNIYSEILNLGQEVCIIRVTFSTRMKGLVVVAAAAAVALAVAIAVAVASGSGSGKGSGM